MSIFRVPSITEWTPASHQGHPECPIKTVLCGRIQIKVSLTHLSSYTRVCLNLCFFFCLLSCGWQQVCSTSPQSTLRPFLLSCIKVSCVCGPCVGDQNALIYWPFPIIYIIYLRYTMKKSSSSGAASSSSSSSTSPLVTMDSTNATSGTGR